MDSRWGAIRTQYQAFISTCTFQASHDDVIKWKSLFRVTGHLCGEFTGNRWMPRTKPVKRSFYVFIDLRLNKRMSKHWWSWWFEKPSRPFWRHCNVGTYVRRLISPFFIQKYMSDLIFPSEFVIAPIPTPQTFPEFMFMIFPLAYRISYIL